MAPASSFTQKRAEDTLFGKAVDNSGLKDVDLIKQLQEQKRIALTIVIDKDYIGSM